MLYYLDFLIYLPFHTIFLVVIIKISIICSKLIHGQITFYQNCAKVLHAISISCEFTRKVNAFYIFCLFWQRYVCSPFCCFLCGIII